MRVLVLGAGFGGLELTTRLSDALGDDVEVILLDRAEGFVFGFSKLDVMFGRTTPDAVFHSQDQAPTSVPFQHYDDKAIVVFDPDDEDDSALRLAYMWARWTVRKGLAVSEEAEIDLERVRCLLDDASRALERHTAIKRFHTQAKKSIDQAADQVRDLVTEVHDALDALDGELRA